MFASREKIHVNGEDPPGVEGVARCSQFWAFTPHRLQAVAFIMATCGLDFGKNANTPRVFRGC